MYYFDNSRYRRTIIGYDAQFRIGQTPALLQRCDNGAAAANRCCTI